MALLSGFETLDANIDTVSTLVTKVNVVIDEMRENVVTANNTLANTNGNARINGLFVSNTSFVIDGLSVGDFLATVEEGSADVVVTDASGINENFVVLAGEAFPINTDVTDIDGNVVTMSNPALKSAQFIGTLDDSAAIDTIQFSRFGLSGGTPGANIDVDIETANLYIVSNTIFTTDCDLVTVEANLQVDTDSLFVGDVEAQSTIEFTGDDSILEFNGANQDFIWLSTNTYATIRTNDAGSLEFNADVAANGDNDSSIELMVDSITVASFFEGGDIAFYSADGLNQKIYWDATNEVLGINTTNPNPDVELDVVGNTQTIDLVVTSETTSGNVVVNDELRGNTVLTVTTNTNFTGANNIVDNDLLVDNELVANIATITTELRGDNSNLIISSNTVFQANGIAEDNFTVNGALTVSTANLIYKLVPDNYDDLIPSANTGDLLGNTTNRWEGFFNNINTNTLDVSGDVSVGDTLTVQNLTVAGNGVVALPPTIAFTGVTEFANIEVTGTANIVSLEVESLTTNAAALVGAGGVANGTSPTVIDDFDKTVSKGFKYIVHGENGDPDSAYAIEINCSHNGANVFFTRFGEVSNKFDCDLTPKINTTSENIELVAVCPSANSSNVHSFNILRIETR